MMIYIVRHGIAEEAHPEGDASRRLTAKGKEKTASVAAAIRDTVNPEVILVSPYIRARETADIFADVLGLDGQVEISDALYPGSRVDETLTELSSRGEDVLMLVGHNPHCEFLVSALIGRREANIDMKKAAVACIETGGTPRPGEGVLKWYMTPGSLGI